MALEGRRNVEAVSTAEGAAALRALGAGEPDAAVRNPDTLARHFVSWGLNTAALVKVPGMRGLLVRLIDARLPGGYAFETARTHLVDDVVRRETEAGIDQLVILGAGFDTRAYRMPELRSVRVFEVDHPTTQAAKRERLARIVAEPPENVTFVAVDFTEDDLGERLAANGYDGARPTLFLWAGVAPYLPEEAVDELLRWVGSQPCSRSSILFDYMWREVLEDPSGFYGMEKLFARVRAVGEPFRSGIPRDRAAEYLAERGLTLEEEADADEAAQRLRRSDGSSLGRTYEGGRLAHARVADS